MDLFQLSLMASPMILIVIMIRLLLLYQLPKRTFKILWLIALFRLLIPYNLPSRFSIFNLFPVKKSAPLLVSFEEGTSVPILSANVSSNASLSFWQIALLTIWLLGCVAVAFFFLRTHLKTRMRFIDSEKIEHHNLTLWFQANTIRRPMRIRFSDQITTPLTYGVFMPVILLPKDTNLENEQQLRLILTHEYIHLCRFDALTKALLALSLCLHWFNPLVWIMFMFANRDIELACDEGVLRTLGYSKREAYAYLLINMSTPSSPSSSIISNFSDNALEERIIAIMKMKKKKYASVALALILTACIVSVFATDKIIITEGFIAESPLSDFQAGYRNDIRYFCYTYKHKLSSGQTPSSWEEWAFQVNQEQLTAYKIAIPDLLHRNLVSRQAAYDNLHDLETMLNGDPVNFGTRPPYIYIEPYNLIENIWVYTIQLHNGTPNNSYYYLLSIYVAS